MKKSHLLTAGLLSSVLLSACVFTADDPKSSSSDPQVAAANFGSQVKFTGGSFRAGPPPTSTSSKTLTAGTSTAGTFYSGSQNPLSIDLTGATAGLNSNHKLQVNVAFTGSGSNVSTASGFTSFDTTVGGLSSNKFSTDFTVPSSVCDNLSDIQHQIDCYESVTLPGGEVVTKDQAQAMILACDGGSYSGTGSYCAYNYPKDACDIVRASFPRTAFISGEGDRCQAFGNVATKEDYNFGGGSSGNILGSVGSCIISY